MWTCPKCGKELTREDQRHYCVKPQSIDEHISQQDASVRPLPGLRDPVRQKDRRPRPVRESGVEVTPDRADYLREIKEAVCGRRALC